MKAHLLFVLSAVSAIGLISMALMPWAPASAGVNSNMPERVSVHSNGTQGAGRSGAPVIADNGRFVAFESDANNLVAGDTNGVTDIFIRDRQLLTTSRVSVGPGGAQANGASYAPAISADGRYVAFVSEATNLVAGDTNGTSDIFVHDRQAATTSRVSLGPGGAQSEGWSDFPAISADGLFVAFISDADDFVANDTNGFYDVFVRDLAAGVTSRVSVASDGTEGDGESWYPVLSANGRYVAFESAAPNLVAGDTNDFWDVFVHDRQTGATSRVSVKTGGAEGDGDSFSAAISADGLIVAFESDAKLVNNDTNNKTDIFVRDRQASTTSRVSVSSNGVQANSDSYAPAISPEGGYVAFSSIAGNLVPGDTNSASDVFLYDRQTGVTNRVSVNNTGVQGDGDSGAVDLTANGLYVAFQSDAANLVANDSNDVTDAFIHARNEIVTPTPTPPPTTVPPTIIPTSTPVTPTHWLYLPVSMK